MMSESPRLCLSLKRLLTSSSDDPWNQTAADNAEWLRRFKREVGILTDPSLPGLPDGLQWSIAQGGSGFAPPYAFPNPKLPVAPIGEDSINITVREGAKPIPTEGATATKYLQTFATRQKPPATVFCSRELENGLASFVETEVILLGIDAFPNDEVLRARARDILKTPNTAADDAVLLDKFKGMMRIRLGLDESQNPASALGLGQDLVASAQLAQSSTADTLMEDVSGVDLLMPLGLESPVTQSMGVTFTEGELNDILQEINFDFGDLSTYSGAG